MGTRFGPGKRWLAGTRQKGPRWGNDFSEKLLHVAQANLVIIGNHAVSPASLSSRPCRWTQFPDISFPRILRPSLRKPRPPPPGDFPEPVSAFRLRERKIQGRAYLCSRRLPSRARKNAREFQDTPTSFRCPYSWSSDVLKSGHSTAAFGSCPKTNLPGCKSGLSPFIGQRRLSSSGL